MRYTLLATLFSLWLAYGPVGEVWHELAASWSSDTAAPTPPPAGPTTPEDGDSRGQLDPNG
jgi:hypothetical protein